MVIKNERCNNNHNEQLENQSCEKCFKGGAGNVTGWSWIIYRGKEWMELKFFSYWGWEKIQNMNSANEKFS